MIRPGRQNPHITTKVRIMYIMLNQITEYTPGLALHIISHLTLQPYPSDIPFSRRLTVTRPLLNAINHQSAYLDETAFANPLFLSGPKLMNARCNG